MKTSVTIMIFCAMFIGNPLHSQNFRLPDIDLYNLDGERITSSDIESDNAALLLVFWNSSDKKSFDQLLMVNEDYLDHARGNNIRILGICTDLNGTFHQIKPMVYANNIDFEIYIDKNNDFKRAMNVSDSPYFILVNNKNNEECRYAGYGVNIEDLINEELDFPLAVKPAKK